MLIITNMRRDTFCLVNIDSTRLTGHITHTHLFILFIPLLTSLIQLCLIKFHCSSAKPVENVTIT